MPRWPIRVKLILGLSLVVGMMLTLMGGSMFGLHAFHQSNLTLTNQLRELGASKDLLQAVMLLDIDVDRDLMDHDSDNPARLQGRLHRLEAARSALARYYYELDHNSTRGDRLDGTEEFTLAFLLDDDLAAIRHALDPNLDGAPLFARTSYFLTRHPEHDLLNRGPWESRVLLDGRLRRLFSAAVELPSQLHNDFFLVLEASKRQYQSSRIIVWTSALAVLVMLFALSTLFHHWVLYPIRLLHRGVRRVARGSFTYKIELHTGDEMQALAEAFNNMTEKVGATYADLEKQVNERSRQLVRSERLAGVGFLAAGVAHEINNPLASIAFCAEALESRLAPILEGKATASEPAIIRNYLRMVQDEAFRCKRITEKLLDFSRCGEIQRQRTDLIELVQSVVDMLRHMGKYRLKHLVFQPRTAVVAQVDPQEIKQVVLNLVVNALDCMKPGGTLRIEVRELGAFAELIFRDDGCGMTPDVLENIFEPFFTKRSVGKGTGLGLSITHRIVSQHHGEISASSPGPDLGSTFIVRLPLQAVERPPPVVLLSADQSSSSTEMPALAVAG
jgi:two-component system, NtrC family, sensor kinase